MISPASSSSHPAYRRRTHYVDSSVQRSLLVSMVTLEVTLVAIAIGFAYWRLAQLIEEGMYRMKAIPMITTMTQFATEGFWILGVFAVVNVIALMVASGIWRRHENLVLRDFMGLIEKTKELDFSSDTETRRQHEVISLAADWRAQERNRYTAVRDQVSKLVASLSSGESSQDTQISVTNLNRLLL